MKLILSRKGFDSGTGKAPSPIVEGRLVSLPIPADKNSETTYHNLGLGDLVAKQTRGRITGAHLCHADPAFHGGRCALGQTGAAQSHLQKQGVGIGDTFLFFGLFDNPDTQRCEHWIFGYLIVEAMRPVGTAPKPAALPEGISYPHPHSLGAWHANDMIYLGEGACGPRAHSGLRLTANNGLTSIWRVPDWMKSCGLSYHGRPERWLGDGTLKTVGRGQEFVCDLSNSSEGRKWVARIIRLIRA